MVLSVVCGVRYTAWHMACYSCTRDCNEPDELLALLLTVSDDASTPAAVDVVQARVNLPNVNGGTVWSAYE